MGIRLVKHGVGSGGEGTYEHNLLINRDMDDQHPITAITGLEDTLIKLEKHDMLLNRDMDDQHPISAITGLTEALTNLGKLENHNLLINRDLPNQHPIKAITGLTEALKIVEFSTLDSNSLHLNYNSSIKRLTGNVILTKSDDNAIQESMAGLFVDKYPDIEVKDTNAIHLYIAGKGMTLYDMYTTGIRFSHDEGTENIKNASEANAWYFDDDLQSFVQPKNTNTFTGFVSNSEYMFRTYRHKATMRSSSDDNDANGLVIAYVLDEDGNPHTLSCIVNKGAQSHVGEWKYALVYNKSLEGEQIILTGPTSAGHTTDGWDNHYITMEVEKTSNRITCAISNWDSLDINPSTMLTIDLHDYEWGHYFIDKVMYGYCNQSQANSYFTDIVFKGKGPLMATPIVSPDKNNGIQIRTNGLYCNNDLSNYYTKNEINKLLEISDNTVDINKLIQETLVLLNS